MAEHGRAARLSRDFVRPPQHDGHSFVQARAQRDDGHAFQAGGGRKHVQEIMADAEKPIPPLANTWLTVGERIAALAEREAAARAKDDGPLNVPWSEVILHLDLMLDSDVLQVRLCAASTIGACAKWSEDGRGHICSHLGVMGKLVRLMNAGGFEAMWSAFGVQPARTCLPYESLSL